MTLSFPPWPVYDKAAQAAVSRVLEAGLGNYWHGPEGRAFEQEFASYCGTKHSLAVANGTVGLELCLRALEIGPGDEVIVTPRSFIASANSVVLCGAKPVFADVDLDSQNITPESVRAALTPATRAIIAVHLAGWPCDMAGLRSLAKERGLGLVEDCAQAHGAGIGGVKVGAMGDIAAFSFCHDKIISTGGEGGMLTTNDEQLWAKAAAFRNHGRDPRRAPVELEGYDYPNLHESVGSNYRMTEMQAAIGRVQLTQLDTWLGERRRNAMMLANALADLEVLRVPRPTDNKAHAYYRLYAFLNQENPLPKRSRAGVVAALRQAGVPCDAGICPEIYLEPAYQRAAGKGANSRLPNARALGETSIAFLVHPGLDDELLGAMAGAIRAALTQAG